MEKHTSESVEEHGCVSLTQELTKAHPDTKASPLCQAVGLYIDGSCHRTEGLKEGFAVVSRNGDQYVMVRSGPVLPYAQSRTGGSHRSTERGQRSRCRSISLGWTSSAHYHSRCRS